MSQHKLLKRIRILIALIIAGLAISGITAFPLVTELTLFDQYLQSHSSNNSLNDWIHRVATALKVTDSTYPFMAYGTDWLTFAHLVIAIAFLGPYKDPIKNRWVIDWGLINCILVIPLAMIAGSIRDIPFFHQLIDCSFGIIGFIILFICRKLILQLTEYNEASVTYVNSEHLRQSFP